MGDDPSFTFDSICEQFKTANVELPLPSLAAVLTNPTRSRPRAEPRWRGLILVINLAV